VVIGGINKADLRWASLGHKWLFSISAILIRVIKAYFNTKNSLIIMGGLLKFIEQVSNTLSRRVMPSPQGGNRRSKVFNALKIR
jgi:hypothetical protein